MGTTQTILDLLVGKTVLIMTEVKVEVELAIANVKTSLEYYELEPATKENDWYPAGGSYTTYIVTFTNGYSKTLQIVR